MSTAFNTILREVLKRVNGIAGAQAAAMATNYAVSPLTTTEADDPVYSLAFVKDVIVDTHGRLALEIASVVDPVTGVGCHPWRAFFRDVTASVGHDSALPTVGSSTKTIIGALGRAVSAGDTDFILTPGSAERVSAFRLYTGTLYTAGAGLYHINGGKVYATVSNVVFDCCVYERADYSAFTGNIALPDALTDALVAGSVAGLLLEDEYAAQTAYYRDMYSQAIAAIRAGSVAMPGLLMGGKAA